MEWCPRHSAALPCPCPGTSTYNWTLNRNIAGFARQGRGGGGEGHKGAGQVAVALRKLRHNQTLPEVNNGQLPADQSWRQWGGVR